MLNTHDVGPVRWLTIDNPGRRNAIPSAEWQNLAEALRSFDRSEQRALVVTGAGEDFCSGADLAADIGSAVMTAAGRHEWMLRVGAAVRALRETAKPTVAAVDGVAVGAGMNLALGCDIVVATDRARFAEIFVKRGLTIDFGGTWLLPRLVGLARAKEMALTGRLVGAREALDYGMVAEVVAAGDLHERAGALADTLAAGAPLAQRFIKGGLDQSFDMSFEQALRYEEQAQSICLTSEDVIEGISAFLQKRAPDFKGR